jgi:hypothetical protein
LVVSQVIPVVVGRQPGLPSRARSSPCSSRWWRNEQKQTELRRMAAMPTDSLLAVDATAKAMDAPEGMTSTTRRDRCTISSRVGMVTRRSGVTAL